MEKTMIATMLTIQTTIIQKRTNLIEVPRTSSKEIMINIWIEKARNRMKKSFIKDIYGD